MGPAREMERMWPSMRQNHAGTKGQGARTTHGTVPRVRNPAFSWEFVLGIVILSAVLVGGAAAVTTTWTVRYEDAPDLGGEAYVIAVAGQVPVYDGLAVAVTNGSETIYSVLSTTPRASWYEAPRSVASAAALPAPFNTIYANASLYPVLQQIGPSLYLASDPAQTPYVSFFGGPDALSAFVCPMVPQYSTGTINCGNASTTDPMSSLATADVWMSIVGVTATDVNVNATITATSDAPVAAVRSGIIAIASCRLATQYTNAVAMTSAHSVNVARRSTAEAYVIALFFLLAWAMLWHIVLTAVMVSWAVPCGRAIDPQASFAITFSVLIVIQLILTLTLGLLGWVIGGILFGLIDLVVWIVLIVVRCRQDCHPAEHDAMADADAERDTGDDMELQDRSDNVPDVGKSGSAKAARHSWTVVSRRFGKAQCVLAIVAAVMVVTSLIIFVIVGLGWETDEYYVYNRQTSTYDVEVQPVTVSKSTLALYTVDGAATAFQMNIFLVTFTSLCGSLYRTELSTYEAKYQAIYVNYVSQYNINMTQFSPSNWTAYTSVNDFFIRPLQTGARPIAFADDDTSVASPADARVYGFQYIPADWAFVIKEETFTVATLINDSSLASAFDGGAMYTVRLAPQDYHRFHAPVSGVVRSVTNLTGTIYSVNADAVLSENLVYYNQRRVVIIDTATFGPVAFVAIGATCVGSIIIGPTANSTIVKGEDIGRFEFGGSTILLLFGPSTVTVAADLITNTQSLVETYLHMGTEIGRQQ